MNWSVPASMSTSAFHTTVVVKVLPLSPQSVPKTLGEASSKALDP